VLGFVPIGHSSRCELGAALPFLDPKPNHNLLSASATAETTAQNNTNMESNFLLHFWKNQAHQKNAMLIV
jgi:hypothetical protein